MAKKIPGRQCIGCGEKKEKKELIRIVRGTDGYFVDAGKKAAGRGAYICRNPECFNAAAKKKGFDRAFKESISAEVIEKLKGELENLEQG